jgi:flagellar hook-length control protein FliK
MTTAPSTSATAARPASSAGAAHAQNGVRRPGAANGQNAGGAAFAQLLRDQTDTAAGPAAATPTPEASARTQGDAAPDEAKGRARREDAATADPSAPTPNPWPPQPTSTVEKVEGSGPDRDGSDPLQALTDAKGVGARRKAGAATAMPGAADAAERRGQADATGRPDHPRAGTTEALAAAVDTAASATPVQPAAADTAPAQPEAQVAGQVTSLGAVAERLPAPATPTPEAVVARASLPEPPGTPAFGPAVGLQLSTWLAEGVQHASLELHPEELGPIDVRIAVQEGRTEVALVADVATTRQALAEALPQLAAALGDVGLSLSGGSVSDQGRPPAGEDARQDAPDGGGRGGVAGLGQGGDRGGAAAASAPAVQRRRQGLLDLYA